MTRQKAPRPAIHYRITPTDPAAHLFEIELRIDRPDPDGQCLTMPAWIPGSYMIRDFARHIVRIEASSGDQTVSLQKVDKQTWQAEPCAGRLLVRYQVYAWDLSVRGAHLDQTHGFFNGTSVFLAVTGQTEAPVSVDIARPAAADLRDWRVATTLPAAGAKVWGFGKYQAADYDELIDHPVEMGRFRTVGFKAGGAQHEIVVTGADQVDMDRLARDLQPICRAQARLFDPAKGRAPIDRYLFLTMAVGQGYGGLEHRASTALICRRDDLPYPGMTEQTEGYRTFLGLASHEYFHTWNVKRIKPDVFSPYQLDQESYTSLLWVFEGFTSYYDDLMLVRTGTISAADYLVQLGRTTTRIAQGPGAALQSIAESSFDAWTRFYRQDENAPNVIVSYYAKGALVALALDLTIRLKSRHRHSLDDVMRLLWDRYGRNFSTDGQGLPEDVMPDLIREATGVNVAREIRAWAYGTEPLPLARLLGKFGVRLQMQADAGKNRWLGWRLADDRGQCSVTHVLSESPAHQAGVSAGDVLVALDGLRIDSEKTLLSLLARRPVGQPATLHVFRADVLMSFSINAQTPPADTANLTLEKPRLARFLNAEQ